MRQDATEAEKALEALRGVAAVTQDGRRVRLEVNLDSPEDVKSVLALEAEGVGLFRTECLYFNRAVAPPEDEQARVYAAVARAMAPRPLTIRTADIGGDRLTHMGLEGPKNEVNPFMGLRGVRLFLRHLDLFKTQLRAMLKAVPIGNVKIMIPMVSSVSEVHSTRRLLNQSINELQAEGVALPKKVELGIMVEIPSAAILLDAFVPHIDFISIGTNDLIQYTLAVDRVNENVSHLYDPFHPAIIRLLLGAVQTAHKAGRWVGACGEMTSDPRAVPLLVGIGCDSLSVSPRMYLRIKQVVRRLRYASMSKVVAKAASCADSDEVRRLLREQGL
jgi:phosphotransferase system enzyme I (PtsI)